MRGHRDINTASVDMGDHNRGGQFHPVRFNNHNFDELTQADNAQKAHNDRFEPMIPFPDIDGQGFSGGNAEFSSWVMICFGAAAVSSQSFCAASFWVNFIVISRQSLRYHQFSPKSSKVNLGSPIIGKAGKTLFITEDASFF